MGTFGRRSAVCTWCGKPRVHDCRFHEAIFVDAVRAMLGLDPIPHGQEGDSRRRQQRLLKMKGAERLKASTANAEEILEEVCSDG